MVGELLDLPIVLVSLVDKDRQWFKSRYGFEGRESSRDSAFCAHTILGDDPLIVKDARYDPRFRRRGAIEICQRLQPRHTVRDQPETQGACGA